MFFTRCRSVFGHPRSRVAPRTRGPRARPKSHLLSVELLEDRLVPDTVSWKAAVSGNWNNPANWDASRVPGNADIAVIAATGANYTVTLDVDATVAGFTLNAANATFSSSGRTFTANGPAIFSDGMVLSRGSTWAGTGPLTNNATFTIDSNVNANDSTIISSPFLNRGTTLLTGPSQGFINGS